ncbi:oligosaccharide biosynthesis protein Alg14-like protein, partial [Chytridium lagenaria]
GGHTSELLYYLRKLDYNIFSERIYVITSGDPLSQEKLIQYVPENTHRGPHSVVYITRSRHVHQSFMHSIPQILQSFFDALGILLSRKPDLVVCNGPGTCVPLCLSGRILSMIGHKTSVVFIESVTRTSLTSLTGGLLYMFVDRFIVQWENMMLLYPKAEYYSCFSNCCESSCVKPEN